jgi:hypothetical protein
MSKSISTKAIRSWITKPSTRQDIEEYEESSAFINEVGFSSTQQALKALNQFVLQQSNYDSDLALYMPVRRFRDNEKSADPRKRWKLHGASAFSFSLRSSEATQLVIESNWIRTKNPFPGLKTPNLDYYSPSEFSPSYVVAVSKTTPSPASMITRWALESPTLQQFEEGGPTNIYLDWAGLSTIEKALKDFDNCAIQPEKFAGELMIRIWYDESEVLPTIEDIKQHFTYDPAQAKIHMNPRNDAWYGIRVGKNATRIENPFTQPTTNLMYYYEYNFIESDQLYYPYITIFRKEAQLEDPIETKRIYRRMLEEEAQ